MAWPVTFNRTIYHGQSFEYHWKTSDGSTLVGTAEASISDIKGKVKLLSAKLQLTTPDDLLISFSREDILTLPAPGTYLFDQVNTNGSDSKTALYGTITVKPGATY